MGRKAKGPRLYLDEQRGRWAIRDGSRYIRTGHAEGARQEAEQALAEYIARKYAPPNGGGLADILVTDVLVTYLQEHMPTMPSPHSRYTASRNAAYLGEFWSDKTLADIRGATCRQYAASRPEQAARRELATLSAAIRYWHREHGPLPAVPMVTLPPVAMPRDRWLTREEAETLIQAAARMPHLERFIRLGLATGTRAGAMLALRWMPNTVGGWIDLEAGVMYRRGNRERETTKRRPPTRLGSEILEHLRRWHAEDGGIGHVIHYNGAPIRTIKQAWATAIMRANVAPGVTPHTLRHTKATWTVQAGVDIREAAEALGMTVKQLEDSYWHHSPFFQKKAAEV